MSRTLRTILGAVLIGVVTITAILIIDRVFGRAGADLTEHQNYTLSQGTRNILSGLGTPLSMKLYYSRVAARKGPEGLRFYNNYYLYVRDLLQEYANLAGGKLTLTFVDPRPFSDEEEDALAAGIERIPLPGDEGFFFGQVAAGGPIEAVRGSTVEITKFAGVDPTYTKLFAMSFVFRPMMKIVSLAACGVIALVLLVFALRALGVVVRAIVGKD